MIGIHQPTLAFRRSNAQIALSLPRLLRLSIDCAHSNYVCWISFKALFASSLIFAYHPATFYFSAHIHRLLHLNSATMPQTVSVGDDHRIRVPKNTGKHRTIKLPTTPASDVRNPICEPANKNSWSSRRRNTKPLPVPGLVPLHTIATQPPH